MGSQSPAGTQLISSSIISLLAELFGWVYQICICELLTFSLSIIFNLREEIDETMTWEHGFVWVESICATDVLYDLVGIVCSHCCYLLGSSKISSSQGYCENVWPKRCMMLSNYETFCTKNIIFFCLIYLIQLQHLQICKYIRESNKILFKDG